MFIARAESRVAVAAVKFVARAESASNWPILPETKLAVVPDISVITAESASKLFVLKILLSIVVIAAESADN